MVSNNSNEHTVLKTQRTERTKTVGFRTTKVHGEDIPSLFLVRGPLHPLYPWDICIFRLFKYPIRCPSYII